MTMRSKLGMAVLLCILGLVGCAKDDENVKENEYSLQTVKKAFESQSLTLVPYGMTGTLPALNKVIPEMNAIENGATTDHSDPEFVYFYMFKTEAARESGVKEINGLLKSAKYFAAYPFLYEKGNMLAIYWAKSKDKPLFNESITSAIQRLH